MLIKNFKPLGVVWETTLRCNMNCMHCGSSAGQSRENELSTKESINLIKDLKDIGTNVITMMGGEPFLRKDWNTIATHIKNLGMELIIISNGFLIDENKISQLKKLNPYAVAISLDGGTSETHDTIRRVNGSFNRCKKGIEMLREQNINTTVITTVHKQNFKELPEIRDYLIGKGVAWQIQMATPIGRFPKSQILSKEDFYSVSLFIASIKKNYSTKELAVLGAHNFGYHSKVLPNVMLFPWMGCQAGISTMGITSDGRVKGCMSLPDDFIQGSIRKKSVKDIWNDSDFASYNRKFTKNDLKGECKSCKHGKRCRGGCLTVSKTLTGQNHNDPYCLFLIEQEMMSK
jgi:radical SAM protein with 4Fe4S-binding SPASM domain